jgi:hypothetical protein
VHPVSVCDINKHGVDVVVPIHLSKMHLIKDDLIWMRDAIKPCNKRKNRDHHQRDFVIPLTRHDLFRALLQILNLIADIAVHPAFGLRCGASLLIFASASLANTTRRRRHGDGIV